LLRKLAKRQTLAFHPGDFARMPNKKWEGGMRSEQQRFHAVGLAALVIASALIAQGASAQVVAVNTRPSGDTVNWGQLNLAPGTTFPTPLEFISFGGINGEATVDKKGLANVQEQCCPTGLWDGNFSPGDILFDTDNTAVKLTLTFKKPLKSIGTQIQANQLAAFVAQLQAFDHNRLLGTFQENSGPNLSAADGSAIFLGVASATANITSVVYTVTINGSPYGFAINQATLSQQ
jgi:hypothetical protein